MEINATDFIWPETIIQSTINGWIYLRPEVIVGVYVLGLFLFIGTFLVLKKKTAVAPARRSLALAFIITALVYAAAYEAIWCRWIAADLTSFYGNGLSNRQVALHGDFWSFISGCKTYVGSAAYSIYPDDSDHHFQSTSLQYHMLPARNKAEGKYLILLPGSDALLDERAHTLRAGARVIRNVTVSLRHGDAFLLRIGT